MKQAMNQAPEDDQIRSVLNTWSARGWLRTHEIGSRLIHFQVESHQVFLIELNSEREVTTKRTISEPFGAQEVKSETRSGSRSRSIEVPTEFVERSMTVEIPESARVVECRDCNGHGKHA